MGTSSIRRKSRHDALRKRAWGSEAARGEDESRDIAVKTWIDMRDVTKQYEDSIRWYYSTVRTARRT